MGQHEVIAQALTEISRHEQTAFVGSSILCYGTIRETALAPELSVIDQTASLALLIFVVRR